MNMHSLFSPSAHQQEPPHIMETFSLATYNYKQIRNVALGLPSWTAWAASKSVNAAFVSRAQLEEFLKGKFESKLEFDKALLRSSATGAVRPVPAEGDAVGEAAAMFPATPWAAKPIRQPAVPAYSQSDAMGLPRPETAPTASEAPRQASTPAKAENAPQDAEKRLAKALADLMQAGSQPAKLDPDQIRAMVKAEATDLVAKALDGFQKVQINIMDHAQGETRQVEGLAHKQLPALLKACSARDMAGHFLNVWLHGPAGSGKTHAAKQVAAALNLPFGFHGSMSMPHELVGFVDAAGTYHKTQFVKRFTEGGLCLLDEVDSGENGPLLALQAALANGDMSLPNGEIVTRHKDFICIAAGNTTGQGATAEYVGRLKIDGAFLSRFPILISWGYDDTLEQAFCGNKDFAQQVQKARAKAKSLGLKVLITPRHSAAGAALIAAGATPAEAAKATYLSGMTTEQAAMMER